MRAIPHRPCDQTPALRAAGDDLFSCARAALARRGSGGAAGSSLPGDVTHGSAREPVRASWRSVTPWRPSPGRLSGLLGSELAPARQTLAFQAPVGGEVLETKIPSW